MSRPLAIAWAFIVLNWLLTAATWRLRVKTNRNHRARLAILNDLVFYTYTAFASGTKRALALLDDRPDECRRVLQELYGLTDNYLTSALSDREEDTSGDGRLAGRWRARRGQRDVPRDCQE